MTGREVSTIDGLLSSDANLYLINPAGIAFGPNASLDIEGSFHASTADDIRFDDGAVFSAIDIDNSQLTIAEPSAFGFLEEFPSAISLDQSQLKVKK